MTKLMPSRPLRLTLEGNGPAAPSDAVVAIIFDLSRVGRERNPEKCAAVFGKDHAQKREPPTRQLCAEATSPAERIHRQTVSTGRADIATGKTAHRPLTLVRPTFSAAKSADNRASPPSARRRYPFRSTLAGRPASQGPEIVRSRGTSRLRRAHSRGETLFPGRPSRYPASAPPSPKFSHCSARLRSTPAGCSPRSRKMQKPESLAQA